MLVLTWYDPHHHCFATAIEVKKRVHTAATRLVWMIKNTLVECRGASIGPHHVNYSTLKYMFMEYTVAKSASNVKIISEIL